ncbi:MAG: hypothetical protein IPN59_15135 [Holophaga sp.]|nr:hypothetical protein [Holophaga sp.]
MGATATSSQVQITGINIPTSISGSNGSEICINSGPFSSTSKMINNNEYFRVRAVCSSNYLTKFSWIVNVGTVSAEFSATTIPRPVDNIITLTPIITNKSNFEIDQNTTIQFTGASDIQGDAYTVDKYLAVCNHFSNPITTPSLSDGRWTSVKPSSVTASVVGNTGPMSGTYNINVFPLINGQIGKPVTTTIEGVWSTPQFEFSYTDDWNSVPHPNGDFPGIIELKLLMGLAEKGIGTVTITPPLGVNVSDVKNTTVSLNNTTYISYTINSPTSLAFQTLPGNSETDYITKSEILTYATVNILYHDDISNSDVTFTKIFTIVDDVKYIGHGQ